MDKPNPFLKPSPFLSSQKAFQTPITAYNQSFSRPINYFNSTVNLNSYERFNLDHKTSKFVGEELGSKNNSSNLSSMLINNPFSRSSNPMSSRIQQDKYSYGIKYEYKKGPIDDVTYNNYVSTNDYPSGDTNWNNYLAYESDKLSNNHLRTSAISSNNTYIHKVDEIDQQKNINPTSQHFKPLNPFQRKQLISQSNNKYPQTSNVSAASYDSAALRYIGNKFDLKGNQYQNDIHNDYEKFSAQPKNKIRIKELENNYYDDSQMMNENMKNQITNKFAFQDSKYQNGHHQRETKYSSKGILQDGYENRDHKLDKYAYSSTPKIITFQDDEETYKSNNYEENIQKLRKQSPFSSNYEQYKVSFKKDDYKTDYRPRQFEQQNMIKGGNLGKAGKREYDSSNIINSQNFQTLGQPIQAIMSQNRINAKPKQPALIGNLMLSEVRQYEIQNSQLHKFKDYYDHKEDIINRQQRRVQQFPQKIFKSENKIVSFDESEEEEYDWRNDKRLNAPTPDIASQYPNILQVRGLLFYKIAFK